MKKLLEFLLEGCWHQWETVKEIDTEVKVWRGATDNIVGKYNELTYVLRCSKCGTISQRKIKTTNQ